VDIFTSASLRPVLLFFGQARNFPLQTRLGWNFNYAQECRSAPSPLPRPPPTLFLPVHFLRFGRNYDAPA